MTATKYLTATPLTSALYRQFTAPDRPGSNAALALKEHAEHMEGDRARLVGALRRAQVTLLSASRGRLTPDEINAGAYEADALLRELGESR